MERNGWPDKFDILPEPVEKLLRAGHHVGEFLLKQLMHIQYTPNRHSNHYRGGAAELDTALYDKPNRWDSEGNWVNQSD